MASQDPENMKELMESLKVLINAEKGLTSRTDDAFLTQCLRSRDFSVEKAFQVLKCYYKANSHLPMENYKPSAYQWAYNYNMNGLMPVRNHNGAAVFVFRAENWEPSIVSPEIIYGMNLMLLEKVAQLEDVQRCGIELVCDLKGFGWKHVKCMTPTMIAKFATVLQDNFPLKYLGIHFINNPAVFGVVYAIAKPFLKEPEKIHLHGTNYQTPFYKLVSKSCLPQEIGGDLGPFNNKQCVAELADMETFFEDNAKYGFKKS